MERRLEFATIFLGAAIGVAGIHAVGPDNVNGLPRRPIVTSIPHPTSISPIQTLYLSGKRPESPRCEFSIGKIGDSNIAGDLYSLIKNMNDKGELSGYDQGLVNNLLSNPCERSYNELGRTSLASKIGWTTAQLLGVNPQTQRTLIEDELRTSQPAVSILYIGTNDAMYVDPQTFKSNYRAIVNIAQSLNVIPILVTLQPYTGGRSMQANSAVNSRIDRYNESIRFTSYQLQLPLIDIPVLQSEAGLSTDELLAGDGIHLSEKGRKLFTHGLLNVLTTLFARLQ